MLKGKWRGPVLIFVLLLVAAHPVWSDVFYKEVQLGPKCTFSISRLWKEENIGWSLPPEFKKVTLDFKAGRYVGKEVLLDASYIRSTRKASVEGAIQNGIRQASSQPGISNFKYSCSDYMLSGAVAKTCLMTYRKGNLEMYYQSLFAVPNNDPYSSYIFTGAYQKSYNKKVIDRIFSSISIR